MRARAAARLRARETLIPSERRAVREARGEVGAALRRVRAGRAAVVPATVITSDVTAQGSRRRVLALAPLVVLVAGLALILMRPNTTTEEPETAAGGAPAPALAAMRESVASRGRSFETVAFVVAEPTPLPTPEPTAAATVAPAARAPIVATGGGRGSAPGPGPGGSGTGTLPAPSAAPATPTPTAAPTPAPTFGPRPAVVTRFTGRVVDQRTGQPISGACVIVGVRECTDREIYTDVTGRFTIDLPLGSIWDVNFGRTGYQTGYRRLVSTSARTIDIGTIRLAPLAGR